MTMMATFHQTMRKSNSISVYFVVNKQEVSIFVWNWTNNYEISRKDIKRKKKNIYASTPEKLLFTTSSNSKDPIAVGYMKIVLKSAFDGQKSSK